MAINYPQRYDDDFLNTIKKVIDHVNEYGKTIQDLVADGQLTEDQYAELITVVNGLVKSGHVKLDDLNEPLKEEINKIKTKATKESLGEVNQDLQSTKDTINDIIVTPAEGITAQEIIDARKGKTSLGEKISELDNSLVENRKIIYDHLYRYGNEYHEKTSGWRQAWQSDSVTEVIAKEIDHISLQYSNEGGVGDLGVGTDVPIDLTYIDTVYVDWEQKVDYVGARSYLVISENRSQPGSIYDKRLREDGKFRRQLNEVDVSDLTGFYYIRVHCATTGTSATVDLDIYNIYTDKEIVNIDGLMEVDEKVRLANVEIESVKKDVDSHIPSIFDVLYRYGKEFEEKTGGWLETYKTEGTIGGTTKELNRMNINFESSGTGEIAIRSDRMIDLSFVDNIYIDWEQTVDGANQRIYLIASEFKSQPYTIYDARVGEFDLVGRRTSVLDVSRLSGEYYIRINAFTNSTSKLNMNIYNIYTDEEIKVIPNDRKQEFDNVVFDSTNKAEGNSLRFCLVSDTHGEGSSFDQMINYLNIIKKVEEYGKLDFICHGGDVVDGYLPNKKDLLNNLNEVSRTLNVKTPTMYLHGNHDDNSYFDTSNPIPENIVTRQEWHNFVLKGIEDEVTFDSVNPLGLYYYKDFEHQKIRAIYLDAVDYPIVTQTDGTLKWAGFNGWGYQERQLNWLGNKALDLSGKDDDWQVIIFTHAGTREEVTNDGRPVPFNSDQVEGILKAFKEGTNFSKTNTGTEEWNSNVSCDFTTQGNRNVIGIFFGHVHRGMPIVTPADLGIPLINARMCQLGSKGAFDIVTVNRDNREVFLTRFGDGEDREYLY